MIWLLLISLANAGELKIDPGSIKFKISDEWNYKSSVEVEDGKEIRIFIRKTMEVFPQTDRVSEIFYGCKGSRLVKNRDRSGLVIVTPATEKIEWEK